MSWKYIDIIKITILFLNIVGKSDNMHRGHELSISVELVEYERKLAISNVTHSSLLCSLVAMNTAF